MAVSTVPRFLEQIKWLVSLASVRVRLSDYSLIKLMAVASCDDKHRLSADTSTCDALEEWEM